MSTEHLNSSPHDQPSAPELDPAWESEMLSFVASADSMVRKEKKNKEHAFLKWVYALKRRFRRRTFNLIITSGATLLLAAVLVVVMICWKDTININAPSTTETEETTTEKSTITLLNKVTQQSGNTTNSDTNASTSSYLEKIDIQNADDTYTISYDESKKTYTLKDYEDIDLSTEMLLTLRHYTETITATQKIQEVSALSAYGLEKPQTTANMHYADGSSARLFIGDKTPSDTGYYGQLEGDDSVYIFESDAVALFRFRSTAFVDTVLISAPTVKSDDTYGTALLKEIRFSGNAYPTPLSLRRSNHNDSEELSYFSYIITAPYLRCTSDAVSTALGGFTSLSADQALFLHPTDEEKEKMGFNDPLMKIEATMAVETEDETASSQDEEVTIKKYYNSVNYTLLIGSVDENGNYIAMLDGVDVIFLISKSTYGYVLDLTYESAVNQYLFFKHISNLERISISFNGTNYDYHLTHYPEKEDQEDQMKVTSDGKVYSTEEFRKLYELIMALERHGTTTSEPTNEATMTLSLYDTAGNLYLSADYFEIDATLCTVKTVEGELFTTLWSDIYFFMRQVENYANGETVLIRN